MTNARDTASLKDEIARLQEHLARLTLVQQQLIAARNQLDLELERFAGIQAYNTQAITVRDAERFAEITVETVLKLFEVEFAWLWPTDQKGNPLDTPQAAAGTPATSLSADSLRKLLSYERRPRACATLCSTKELASSGLAGIKQIALLNCVGPGGSPLALIITGISVANGDFYPELGKEDLESLAVYAQQVGALLQNRADQALILGQMEQLHQEQTRLQGALERAEAADRAKGQFLANMSHEIRTPLHGILGMTHLALQRAADERQRDYLLKIESAAKSLLGVLTDLIDFSKLEAGSLVIEKSTFDLYRLVEQVIHLVEIEAHDKGLALSAQIDPGLERLFYADPRRLTQVLASLLGNAIKFTPAGSVSVHIRQPAPDRLRFEIRDTGIGIAPEQREEIFAAFSQADGGTTRCYGGIGLGLAICRQLVELMDGRMEVDSNPGEGSCFSFEIAAHPGALTPPDSPPAVLAPHHSPPSLTATLPRSRIAANPENVAALFEELRQQARAGNSRKCREIIAQLAALDLPAPQDSLLGDARRLLEQRNYLRLQNLPRIAPR